MTIDQICQPMLYHMLSGPTEGSAMTRLRKQIFAKLGLFGSEANPQNGREGGREGRCKDFSVVFALGFKDAEC